MKSLLKPPGLIIIIFLCILHSCKKEELPTISTSTITNITATSATCGGNITSDGNASVTSRGVCWSLNTNPIISDSKTNDVAGAGQFVSSLTGLTAGSTYHVRAYATNSVGTAYGADMAFSTLGQSPTCLTQAATDLTATTVKLNGIVNANYLSTTVTFEYGTSTNYGQAITAGQSPVTGNSITNVSIAITGLAEGTTYHFKVKAANSIGTISGDDMSFRTLGQSPTAITQSASWLTTSGAKLIGIVNANYVSTTVTFEYGTTTEYGSSVAATPNAVTGNVNTDVVANLSGLPERTTYHFRIKADNSLGLTYGNDMSFTTLSKITDFNGNIYEVVQIGAQIWMAENLKTTKYSDGSEIPLVNNSSTWNALLPDGKAYCWYGDDIANKSTYGALYTWAAAMNGSVSSSLKPSGVQGVCPTGWHLPSDNEWAELVTYLGVNAGGKLKETGTVHWQSPNAEATNESGFAGLPGGQRFIDGLFVNLRSTGTWWCSTEWSSSYGWYRGLSSINGFVDRSSYYKSLGQSVRCLKD